MVDLHVSVEVRLLFRSRYMYYSLTLPPSVLVSVIQLICEKICILLTTYMCLFCSLPKDCHNRTNLWYLSFQKWLISLNLVVSSWNHFVANDRLSFFLMDEQYSRVDIPRCLCSFICWQSSGLSPCLHYCELQCYKYRVGGHSLAWRFHLLWIYS